MLILLLALAGYLFYAEVIYHLGCFGLTAGTPVFVVPLVLAIAGIFTVIIGSVPVKWKKAGVFMLTGISFLLVAAQMVYMNIFKQPLLWEAAVRGGQDALINYWREALAGVVKTLPYIVLLALPLLFFIILFALKKWPLPVFRGIEKLRSMLITGVGIILAVMVIFIGKYADADFYEDYSEFVDPLSVAENMGIFAMIQRDAAVSISGTVSGLLRDAVQSAAIQREIQTKGTPEAANVDTKDMSNSDEPEPVVEVPTDTSPHRLAIDFAKLAAEAKNDDTKWLAAYMEELTPTNRNEYTGIFEGYNLIYLTLEGFSPYAIREDLTPALYRLVNSGFVFTNYYVPLWQTSTSDGEYINMTGLIPDRQFSMRKSGENDMTFTLPRYFAGEGVASLAYHNNSLSYYDRYITHTNLGYDFKGAKLGRLSEEEWGDKVFPMDNPDNWPASDLDMLQHTLPEYLDLERFHVYYMTVSGHMNYDFKGNAMSYKNKEAVEHLPMSEIAQAYIACNIELDKALAYLLEELEAAGKLENTVICMSADHYPYGMNQSEYEELAGKPLGENLDIYRNSLFLWNAGMEAEPVVVEKVCGPMDILPTLLNLFGFSYDSRVYAGRDIFSDTEGMVIFNDRSFITDTVIYNRKTKMAVWRTDFAQDAVSSGDLSPDRIVAGQREALYDAAAKDQYLEEQKQEVWERCQFSAYILRNNYYQDVKAAVTE